MSLCKFYECSRCMKCSVCGRCTPIVAGLRPDQYFSTCSILSSPENVQSFDQEKYFGDYTKELLAKTTFGGLIPGGITEELYKSVKAELGFAPTCDCPDRIEWMNKADKALRKLWGFFG